MPSTIILFYLFLCLIVGLGGVRTSLGFLRSFALAILLSPFVLAVVLLILPAVRPAATGKDRSSGTPGH